MIATATVRTALAGCLLTAVLAPTLGPRPAAGQEAVEYTEKREKPKKLSIDFASIETATVMERDGDTSGALAVLEGASERSPEDGTLLAARGAILLRSGDVEAARIEFQRAVDANPSDPSGFAGQCVLAVMEGRPMIAEDRCLAARTRNIEDPIYAEISMAAGMLDNALGDVATSALDTLVVANPYVPALRLLSLEANLRVGNDQLARNDLGLLHQIYHPPGDAPPRILDRIAAFKLADIVGPDIPCSLAWSEVQLLRLEEREPTGKLLLRAAACRPDDDSLRSERVEQLNRDAVAARANGDHATAVDLLRQALELQPDDTVLLNNLAHFAFEGGDPTSAEAALRRLLELSPDDADLRRNYGIALMALGREDEAQPYLEGAAPQ